VGIAVQREVGQVRESFRAPFGRTAPRRRITPQDLGDLDIEQVGRVEGLASGQQPILEPSAGPGAEQYLDHG